MKSLFKITSFLLSLLSLYSCSISYTVNGSTIDYSRIKTITIEEIPNQAPLVHPPLSQLFTESLRDSFRRKTRLSENSNNGDIIISGAIVGYELTPVAVQEDAFSSSTRFTLTVSIDYLNQVDVEKSFSNKTFSSYTEFDSSRLFSDVQDALCKELVDDIIKQIFNATVEDW